VVLWISARRHIPEDNYFNIHGFQKLTSHVLKETQRSGQLYAHASSANQEFTVDEAVELVVGSGIRCFALSSAKIQKTNLMASVYFNV
jgi:hypothetical protein